LKYLDDHEVMRLGGIKPKKVNCTIIAATNRDLESLAKNRMFRQDLFYRLNTFTILIPPLRERPQDIFELVNRFLREYNKTYRLKRRISPEVLTKLQSYPFPGNVRELKNILKKAVVMSEEEVLDDLIVRSLEGRVEEQGISDNKRKDKVSLDHQLLDVERKILKSAMARCKSTREIANYLGTSQPTVVRKMKKHGLSRSLIQ